MQLDDVGVNHPLDAYSSYVIENTSFILKFGNNRFRMEWINKLNSDGAELATIIHHSAYMSPKAIIEEGVHICLKTITKGKNRIRTLSKIEAGNIIEARIWLV